MYMEEDEKCVCARWARCIKGKGGVARSGFAFVWWHLVGFDGGVDGVDHGE